MDWGGWELLQFLLKVLNDIAQKHIVSISNVATRWVLQHEYVGAVIIGARMGISEHIEDNAKVFSFDLDQADLASIDEVLNDPRCTKRRVFETLGDCGSEYRKK